MAASRRLALALAAALVLVACGSRSQPSEGQVLTPLQRSDAGFFCLSHTDCPSLDLCQPLRCRLGACVAEPVVCQDDDPCTEDRCDPTNGECRFERLSVDRDGDGHYQPLPGFKAGSAGACGDDCDDASARAFPGGAELCDGVDNDCDGVVDNGARFSPSQSQPTRLSEGADLGSPGGLAFSGKTYGLVYSARGATSRNTFRSFGLRSPLGPEIPVAEVNSDTFAGPIVWSGNAYGVAWEDRRDEDYEVYFNRLTAQGGKLGADVRVTAAQGFSLRPALEFANDEFLLVWEDERDDRVRARIYGQRIDATGRLVEGNVQLSPSGFASLAPSLAGGQRRLGLVYLQDRATGPVVLFKSLSLALGSPGKARPARELPEVVLSGPLGAGASITAHQGRFVVAWHTEGTEPGPTIRGAIVSEEGEILQAARALTEPAAFARWHSVLPLADRLILFWSEHREGRYNVYARELSADLLPLSEATAVTRFARGAYGPMALFGPGGQIGMLFTGVSDGPPPHAPHAYFLGLACSAN